MEIRVADLRAQEIVNTRLNKLIITRSRNCQERHQSPGGLRSSAIPHSAQRVIHVRSRRFAPTPVRILVLHNTLYTAFYCAIVLSVAAVIFSRKDLK